MSFHFKKLALPDCILIEPTFHKDHRGFLIETYKHSEFVKAGIQEEFKQENFSYSGKHVLRGLHYQLNPSAQGKLIQCLRGRILDISVDIRKNSPTFGKWVCVELFDVNHHILYIPKGFAHGFIVLSDEALVSYKTTKEYSPKNERGILWNDPDLHIQWPVPDPILSEKDAHNPLLKEMENNFYYE